MEAPWSYLLYFYGVLVDVLSLCEAPVKLNATELNRDQYLGRWFFIAAASSSASSLETFATTDNTVFSMTQSSSLERLQLQAAIQLKTGQCVPKSWIYLLKDQSADLATEDDKLTVKSNRVSSEESPIEFIETYSQGHLHKIIALRCNPNQLSSTGISVLVGHVWHPVVGMQSWRHPQGRPHMRTELFSAKCRDCIIVQETDQDYQRILLYSRVLHPAENCVADFKDKASCLDMDEFLLIPRTQNTCEFQET